MALIVLPAWTANKIEPGRFSAAPFSLPEKVLDVDLTELRALVALAREAACNAHAPFSNFRVGAALRMADDESRQIFSGANIENSSFGLTMCAERVAVQSAAAAGFRRIRILAVSCPDASGRALAERSPCGACRQVIREFAEKHTIILLDRNDDQFGADVLDIDRLLPWGFSFGAR